jgi:L-alanine-DL-glutamate epimerase-like enolase superfamily enzyme
VMNGTVMPPDLPGSGISWNKEAVGRYHLG